MNWPVKQGRLGGCPPQACLDAGTETVVPRLHRKHVGSARIYNRSQMGEDIFLLEAHILSAPTFPLCLFHSIFQRFVYLLPGFIFKQAPLKTATSNCSPTSDPLGTLKGKASFMLLCPEVQVRALIGLTWVTCPSLSQSLSVREWKSLIGHAQITCSPSVPEWVPYWPETLAY